MADVTICIPTWQAEAFIDRTLDCAKAQTHPDIRILISVDVSSDRTAEICRAHAGSDPRIDVRVQSRRLGWSENCNFLLDQVDTELCTFYFHDDIIEPTYIERLRAALLTDPEVQSAHCDLERFGNEEGILPGVDYNGSAAERLAQLLVAPVKGTPLRSLFRSRLVRQGLRFPGTGGGDGWWRLRPFLMRLVGSGPARRVPEVLYRRWFRNGSLTTSWGPSGAAALLEDQRQNAAACLDVIRALGLAPEEERFVTACLYGSLMLSTRRQELRLGVAELIAPAAVAEAFRDCQPPIADAGIRPDLLEWARRRFAAVLQLEGKHALARHPGLARSKFAQAAALNPKTARAQQRLTKQRQQSLRAWQQRAPRRECT